MTKEGSAGNVIAAVCSFFIPGLGQLVQGQLLKALIFFVVSAVFYATVVLWPLGVIAHIWSIIDAARFHAKGA